jgi:transcriptional regulator with XRE-family HTH domain
MRTITTLEELADALRERRMQLGLSQTVVDDLAGLTGGYTSKIEMGVTNPEARNARRLGADSMPLLLGALKLELIVRHATGTKANFAHDDNGLPQRVGDKLIERARLGGRARWAKMTDAQRKKAVLKLNRARREKRKAGAGR